MTPERAKEICEECGCTFEPTGLTGNRYTIQRGEDNYHYINKVQLSEVSEAQFRYFYIIEERGIKQ